MGGFAPVGTPFLVSREMPEELPRRGWSPGAQTAILALPWAQPQIQGLGRPDVALPLAGQ